MADPVALSEAAGRMLRTKWEGENGAQMLSEELYGFFSSIATNGLILDSPLVLRQAQKSPALSIVRTGGDPDWQPTQLVDQPPGGFYGPFSFFTPGPYSDGNPDYPTGFLPLDPGYYNGGLNFTGNPTAATDPGANLYTKPTPTFDTDGGPVGPPIGGGGGSTLVGTIKSGAGKTYTVSAYLDTNTTPPAGTTTDVQAAGLGLADSDRLDAGTPVYLSLYGGKYVFIVPFFQTSL